MRFNKFNVLKEYYVESSDSTINTVLNDALATKLPLVEYLESKFNDKTLDQIELFTLFKGVLNYFYPNQGLVIDTDNLLCRCFGVSRASVKDLIDNGASDLLTITNISKAGGGCGSCIVDIRPMLKSKSTQTTIPAVTFNSYKKETVAGKRPWQFLKEDLFPLAEQLGNITIEALIGDHLYIIADEASDEAKKFLTFVNDADSNVKVFFI